MLKYEMKVFEARGERPSTLEKVGTALVSVPATSIKAKRSSAPLAFLQRN